MKRTLPPLLAALLSTSLAIALPQQPVAATASPTAPAGPQYSAVTVDENVAYSATNPELQLDVYRPAGTDAAPRTAIILIHGGGWTSLDKSTMRGMGNFLARHGYVAFSIDYRLFKDGQNPWPAQLDDVQRAVRWIRANAPKYNIDPNHIGAFGHSAGAQLAALLGMEDTRDNSDPALAKYSSRVQAVVDVSGPIDFTTGHDAEDNAFLAHLLAAGYAEHPAVWRNASPAFHVAKTDAPFLIVHGTQDQNVPIAQSQELYDKLKAAGVPVSFIKVDDGHTFRTPDARHQLAIATLEFFDRTLSPAK